MRLLKKAIPVLMYHRIDRCEPSSLVVSPELFTSQVNWLVENHFQFLSLDEVTARSARDFLWSRVVALTFDDGHRDNYENAFPILAARKLPAALFVVVDWVGKEGYLNWSEIRELSRQGMVIGSHSLTHRWLPRITDERELESEILDSKRKLEDVLGQPVRHFSYPVGGVDERVAAVVRKAGYEAAWVAGARPTLPPKDRRLGLRRVKVTPPDSNLIHFAAKACGLKGWFW